jgi:outer membrane protein assembly factor BamB
MSAVVTAPGIAVADVPEAVVGLDPATGREVWTVPRTRGPLDPPAVDPSLGKGGVVVYPEGNGGAGTAVAAIDLTTRSPLWRMDLTRPARGAPAIVDGTAYFGSQDDFVYAVDAADGRLLWKRKTEGPVDTSPAVDGGRVFVVAESTTLAEARLYALSASDGSVAWTYAATIRALGSTSPTVARGMVFVGMGDSRVHALDEATGNLRWTAPVRSFFTAGASPAIDGGDLYVADVSGALYRFRVSDGVRIWDYQFDALSGTSGPVLVGGIAFLGLENGTVGAVDPAGFQIWSARLSTGAVGPLTPAGDLLFAPTAPMKGETGGLVAFVHDPAGTLVHVVSPTRLRVLPGLLSFLIAVAIVMALLLALFRLFVLRRRGRSPSEPAGDAAPAGAPERDGRPGDPVGEEVDA